MENIKDKVVTLEARVTDHKSHARPNVNEEFTIHTKKGELREILSEMENNKVEGWDNNIGKPILTFDYKYTDNTHKNGFIATDIKFLVCLIYDKYNHETPMQYNVLSAGVWVDEFNDEHKFDIREKHKEDELVKAIKHLEEIMDKYEDIYIPKQAKQQLKDKMEDVLN